MASTAECTDRTCCEAGQHKDLATFGTTFDVDSSDGICLACPIATFSAAQVGATDITADYCPDTTCTSCGAGYVGLASELQVPDNAGFSAHCQACPAGTIQPEADQFALSAREPAVLATCVPCTAGYWSTATASAGVKTADGDDVCENPCSVTCPTNDYVSTACTATSDRECAPKPAPTCSADVTFEEQGDAAKIMLSAGVVSSGLLNRVIIDLVGSISADTLAAAGASGVTVVQLTNGGIELSSTAGAAASVFQAAMQEITFESSPAVLSTAERSLTVEVTACTTDAHGVEACGSSCQTKVQITLCLACLPTIVPSFWQPTNASEHYLQGSSIAVATGPATVADQDSPYMKSGFATLGTTCTSGDELAYTANANITVSYNATACSMLLTANSDTVPVATFDAMFQSITFKSSVAAGLSFVPRSLGLTVTDHHDHVSPIATRVINVDCAPGFHHKTSTCTSCPAGQWSDQNPLHHPLNECVKCLKGKIGSTTRDQTSIAYCSQCDAGTYTIALAQMECIGCKAGSYGSGSADAQTAHTYCKDCPNGKYQPLDGGRTEDGPHQCKSCESGYYNNGTYPSMRVNCHKWTCCTASGLYQAGGSESSDAQCLSCAQGTWLTAEVSDDETICHAVRSCTWCAAGKHGKGDEPRTSKAHCKDCKPGSYSQFTIDPTTLEKAFPLTVCTLCAAGTFQSGTAQISCKECNQGTYAVEGATKCTSCAKGRYGNRELAVESADHCSDCAAGRYSNVKAATECIACKCGTFVREAGVNVECKQCAAGTFLAASEAPMTECTACDAGEFAGLGACKCTSCPQGEFCPEGEACGAGAKKLVDSEGFATHHATAGVCKECAAGTFNSWTKQVSCQHCPDGKYQDATSYKTCHVCAAGQYSGPEAFAADAVDRRHVYCVNCETGRYADTVGSTTCSVCPAGKHTVSRFGGAITCTTCVAGKYTTLEMNRGGTYECASCAAGTYAPAAESSSCIDCAAGKFNGAVGQSSALACQDCLAGTYNADAGQASCDSNWNTCGKGEFLKFDVPADIYTQAGTCTSCPAGKFQDEAEISTPDKVCKDISEVYCKCDAGEYLAGSTEKSGGVCTSCPAGKFKPVEADKHHWATLGCENCPTGQFGTEVSQTGVETCKNCAAGTYAAAPGGASTCTACAEGTFSPVKSGACSACGTTVGDWSEFGTCTATCGGGTQTRTRTLTGAPNGNEEDREAQCPTTESRACNVDACPKSDQCHFLKCRYAENPATGKFGIQVYHHGKEPHSVHHCKLFEMGGGKKHCQCSCWNSAPTTEDRRLLAH
jgi:hypothetical protein